MKKMISRRSFLKVTGTAFAVSALAACGASSSTTTSTSTSTATSTATDSSTAASPVTLNVVTSYGGDDGNRANYEAAYKAYEEATGNTVLDGSETSDETWKAKINTDFETGSEPDVLFYFNGVDSNNIVESGKVVSIDTIREVYPDFASNMKDDMLGASPLDGVNYSVPVNGYWEGLFCNEKVLADCGVDVPGAGTTFDEFMDMCDTILAKGYTPIACSLQEVPHYWFEFAVYNHGDTSNHIDLPEAADDAVGVKWAAGLDDIKAMYEAGCFPVNTLTAGDADTFQLMTDDKAAFAIDGSWKIGYFQENAMDIADFTVSFVPGKGDRASTDIIGGLSMGYYITTKAWDDPAKQQAAVDFVTAMTTDEVVSSFGVTAVTALVNGTSSDAELDALTVDALAMTKGSTGIAPAAQDGLNSAARANLFANIKNIAVGNMTSSDAIAECLTVEE
ncbi:MAG: ABC transporter substrate-binding protein [Faecalibacterium sp.]